MWTASMWSIWTTMAMPSMWRRPSTTSLTMPSCGPWQSGSVVFNTDKAALVTYDGKTKTVDTTKDYLDGVINTYANNTEKQIGDARRQDRCDQGPGGR